MLQLVKFGAAKAAASFARQYGAGMAVGALACTAATRTLRRLPLVGWLVGATLGAQARVLLLRTPTIDVLTLPLVLATKCCLVGSVTCIGSRAGLLVPCAVPVDDAWFTVAGACFHLREQRMPPTTLIFAQSIEHDTRFFTSVCL